mmetsp:Transcript_56441/g.98658  ORF Transcript_56441/g.98658 Transcript_56441/m.98658 type:complete len:83 (-) Transcript_56441:1392-1640(-)
MSLMGLSSLLHLPIPAAQDLAGVRVLDAVVGAHAMKIEHGCNRRGERYQFINLPMRVWRREAIPAFQEQTGEGWMKTNTAHA